MTIWGIVMAPIAFAEGISPPTLNQPTSPTNQTNITITGNSEANLIINVSINGQLAATTIANPDGNFSLELTLLTEGSNSITATASNETEISEASIQVIVILDTTPPIANAGTDKKVNENTLVIFDASASTDNIGIVSYEWNFGDGTPNAPGELTSHKYSDPGVYNVTLTTKDAAGNSATDTITVTVKDITSPTADAGGDKTVNDGSAVNFDGIASKDNVGITSYTWNFGDGTTGTGAKVSHTYPDPGNYTVTLTVKDAAGNSDTDTIKVEVKDITQPIVNITSPASGTVTKKTITVSGIASDNVGVKSVTLKVNDGTPVFGNISGDSFSFTNVQLSRGENVIKVEAFDGSGNVGSASVTVNIQPLTVSITSPKDGNKFAREWDYIQFNSSVSGGIEPYTYKWTSSVDGVIGTTKSFSKNSLSASGFGTQHTITLSVTDSDSKTATNSTKITVIPNADLSIIPTEINYKTNSDYIIDPGDAKSVEMTVENLRTDSKMYNVSFNVSDELNYLQKWIDLDKWEISEFPPGGKKYVTMTISVPNTTETGIYCGALVANSSNGGTERVNICISTTDPRLKVSKDKIEKEMRSTIYEEIQVENSGTGTLRNVRLVPSPTIEDYFKFEPNEFNVKQGAPVKVRAIITPPSEPAKYTGTINIYTDNGGSHRIDVSLQVLPPVLVASPDNISVSLKPYESSTKNIILHNDGSSVINNITLALSGEAGGWVILSKNFVESLQPNGDIPITATIKVSQNTAKGQYSGTINIASEAGSPSIPLEVYVSECPVGISITEPSEINEEIRIAEIRSVFIKVKNLGCQDLNVQVGASGEIKDWIIFNPSNFTMGPSGFTTIQASILVPTSAKVNSEYTGIITIKGTSSSNESVSGELKVKIQTLPPTLRTKPTSIEVATYPGVAIPQTLYLENIGSTAFNKVSLSAEGLISNWISFKNNDFPISANARKYVAIEIAPPSSAALTIHKGKIVINADGVYTQVEISVNVTPPLEPVIIPNSLNLKLPSGHTMSGAITIRDLSTGSGQVFFDVTGGIKPFLKINPSDWIYTPSEKSGTIKYTVTIPSEVSGTFKGWINLTGDINTAIPVTITTTEPPETYLSISNTVAQTSGTVEVPININKASNIGAIDLKLEYDATVLDATSVSIGSLGGIVAGCTNTDGVVIISIANVNGFNGNGSVAKVTFDVIGSEGDISPLTLTSVKATDASTFQSVALSELSGICTIGTCGVSGDLNGDGVVTSTDALKALQMAVGNLPVNNCADVNGDGAVTSADALMILQASVGNIKL